MGGACADASGYGAHRIVGRALRRAGAVIAAACLLDALVGDPSWAPHPVRLMGAAIALGERRFNTNGGGTHADGALLALLVIGASALAGCVAGRSAISAVIVGASTLAARDLLSETHAVATALEHGTLDAARLRVARIVGRDTADLDACEVARAAIETLAESACDGVVAPLLWFAVAGLPGALAFKAASTLDSMIGHREPRLLRFGAFAARTDDVLNFVPARLTAALIALAGGAPLRSLRVAWCDAPRHASPNAGWPEAALAGALDLRLGGRNAYAGVVHDGAILNVAGRAPDARALRCAMRVVSGALLGAAVCAIAVRA